MIRYLSLSWLVITPYRLANDYLIILALQQLSTYKLTMMRQLHSVLG